MTNTPPPDLVQQISLQALESIPDDELGAIEIDEAREEYIANFFAQWGADQELEACCEWVSQWRCMVGGSRPEVGLRAVLARWGRPAIEPEANP